MRAYWWRNNHPYNNPDGPASNWGDELNNSILYLHDIPCQWAEPAKADLVMVGSILEQLPQGWAGTVCGAGKLHGHTRVDLSHAQVHALRGELTLAGITGLKQTPVLGDPALLAPFLVPQPAARYDLGVIAHWSDTELWDRFQHGHRIDPTGLTPAQVIAEIASCKRIISSSLHGIIVADAYGIPRQAELFPQATKEGGDFKFRDYQSIYRDKDPHFGHMWQAPAEEVEYTQTRLRVALAKTLGLPAPHFNTPAPPTVFTRKRQISILVPFRDDGEHRSRVWAWLRKYWQNQLPDAEIIEGHDGGVPFCKARAVNQAASTATGDVFVILDADAYMEGAAIQDCVDRIRAATSVGGRLWFMPYDRLQRLPKDATEAALQSDPLNPPHENDGRWWWPPLPPKPKPRPHPHPHPKPPPSPPPAPPHPYKKDQFDPPVTVGHQYGALIQIMPREAFEAVQGMDPRFTRGWGGEDGSLLRALDTLYAQHHVAHNDVYHFWHESPGTDYRTRRWVGQTGTDSNSRLAQRYVHATGEPGFMRALVDEHPLP